MGEHETGAGYSDWKPRVADSDEFDLTYILFRHVQQMYLSRRVHEYTKTLLLAGDKRTIAYRNSLAVPGGKN